MEGKKWCTIHGYPLPCNKCGLGEYERGLEDGKKKVVDWINNHLHESPACSYKWCFGDRVWQVFKKENGLK